jgi:hypothetical protein
MPHWIIAASLSSSHAYSFFHSPHIVLQIECRFCVTISNTQHSGSSQILRSWGSNSPSIPRNCWYLAHIHSLQRVAQIALCRLLSLSVLSWSWKLIVSFFVCHWPFCKSGNGSEHSADCLNHLPWRGSAGIGLSWWRYFLTSHILTIHSLSSVDRGLELASKKVQGFSSGRNLTTRYLPSASYARMYV